MTQLRDWLVERPELMLIVPILTFVLGIMLTLQLVRWLGRVRGRSRHRKGHHAEKRAVKLLRKRGYRILETAPVIESTLIVDGETRVFAVTPDFLVSDGTRELVVEVKRHLQGNSIANAGIRRQVLEYLYAAERPCLLIAMPEGSIEEIDLNP